MWIQVFVAMSLGAVLGWWQPSWGTAMQPLGDAFIKAIRVLIAPLIFCTVVTGIAQISNTARVGRLAIKAIVYFEVLTTAALIIGLVLVNLLGPGRGMNVDPSHLAAVPGGGGVGIIVFLTNIIPSTFVGAFAEGNILQILFVST